MNNCEINPYLSRHLEIIVQHLNQTLLVLPSCPAVADPLDVDVRLLLARLGPSFYPLHPRRRLSVPDTVLTAWRTPLPGVFDILIPEMKLNSV